MKSIKYLFVSLFVLALSLTGFALTTPCDSYAEYSPQVCQFSLTSYSGTVNNGYTGRFKVNLSCPQESDIYATVVVFINDTHIASEVIKVPAGKTQSSEVNIKVGYEYNGNSYRLVVQ